MRILGTLFYLFCANSLKFLLFGNLRAYGPARDQMMRAVIPYFGISRVAHDDQQTLFLIAAVYCITLGWIFHWFMGSRSFGPNINGLISLAGCLFVLLIFGTFVGQFNESHVNKLMLAAIVASAVAITLFSWVKRILFAEAEAQFVGGRPSAPSKAEIEREAATARLEAMAARKH